MNVAFSIVLLFILLDCVTNEKPPCAKGCHVPLIAFYRPVKALLMANSEYSQELSAFIYLQIMQAHCVYLPASSQKSRVLALTGYMLM